MRVVFMGTPDFAVPVLSEILTAGHEMAAVYTQPPRPAGRGMAPRKSPVHILAEHHGIAVLTPASLRGEALRCLACDALSSLAFAYLAMDSLPSATRVVERWIERQPGSSRAYDYLADVLRLSGRIREAEKAASEAIARGLSPRDTWIRLSTIAYHAEDFGRADSILEAHLHSGTAPERWDAATQSVSPALKRRSSSGVSSSVQQRISSSAAGVGPL